MQVSNHFHALLALPSKKSLKHGWAPELHRTLCRKEQHTSRATPNALEERTAYLQSYTERSAGKNSIPPELHPTLCRKEQHTSRATPNALEERTAYLQSYTERSGEKAQHKPRSESNCDSRALNHEVHIFYTEFYLLPSQTDT